MSVGIVPSPETPRDIEAETIRIDRASFGQTHAQTRRNTSTHIPFSADEQKRAKERCMACLLGDKK
jgi:hypothetical protein